MHSFETISISCSEWVIAANIVLTMISGSVADERAFSAMKFIKNDLRNRLDVNLEACLLAYMQNFFTTGNFPYAELGKVLKELSQAECDLEKERPSHDVDASEGEDDVAIM